MGLLFDQTRFFISAFIKKDERNTGVNYTTDTVRLSSNMVCEKYVFCIADINKKRFIKRILAPLSSSPVKTQRNV